MALKLSSHAQLVFFNTLFGEGHQVTKQASALIAGGTTFETSLYSVIATLPDKSMSEVQLTKGTTALMKQVVDPVVVAQNKAVIEKWISTLKSVQDNLVGQPVGKGVPEDLHLTLIGVDKLPNLPLIKAVMQAFGVSLAAAKKIVEHAANGKSSQSPAFPDVKTLEAAMKALQATGGKVKVGFAPYYPQPTVPVEVVAQVQFDAASKPTNDVIALKDAVALGQPVHGTSAGSVYYTVAIGGGVRVAARLYQAGSVSLRAEWLGNPKENLEKLKASGMGLKSNYGSIHFDAGDVPLPRVVGAFLMGTGIKWDAVITNGAELVLS